MAIQPEEKFSKFIDEVDKFLQLVEEQAAGARQQLARGRIGDASIGVSGAYEFSQKAGRTLKKLFAYAHRTRRRYQNRR